MTKPLTILASIPGVACLFIAAMFWREMLVLCTVLVPIAVLVIWFNWFANSKG